MGLLLPSVKYANTNRSPKSVNWTKNKREPHYHHSVPWLPAMLSMAPRLRRSTFGSLKQDAINKPPPFAAKERRYGGEQATLSLAIDVIKPVAMS